MRWPKSAISLTTGVERVRTLGPRGRSAVGQALPHPPCLHAVCTTNCECTARPPGDGLSADVPTRWTHVSQRIARIARRDRPVARHVGPPRRPVDAMDRPRHGGVCVRVCV